MMTLPYYEGTFFNASHAEPDYIGQDNTVSDHSLTGSPDSATGMIHVEELLSKKIGLEPESLGRKRIADIVNSRMELSGIADVNKYLQRLESDPGEFEGLIEDLTVPETWFFRDIESFNYLKKYVDDIKIAASEKKALKILSVPCSTGEEPYSIAITLLEAGLLPEQFEIDAIDINPKALRKAKSAIYGKGAFRGENREYKDKYFTSSKKGFLLDPAVAGLVNFYRANFMQPHALWNHGPYRVIFCKNLLIYLNDDARKKVFDNISSLLLREGIVFTGHAELLSFLQSGFSPIKHSRSFACRKIESVADSNSFLCQELNPAGRPHKDEKLKKSFYKREDAKFTDATVDAKIHKNVPETNLKKLKSDNELSISMVRKLADEGSLDEALILCEQFLEKHKRNKEAYYLMGLINLALNIFDKAEEFFQKTLYLDPKHYEALMHMQLLHEKKGDYARASAMKGRIKRFKEKNES
jgi:chemotaxis protein methyltransferase WspC